MPGRIPHPRTDRPCDGCGTGVPVVVGDTPRGPLWCTACRPGRIPSIINGHRCDRDGCGELVAKITGVQRRRWELGRPVYCSPACRTADLSWVESCAHCRTPMLVNRKRARGDVVYCSDACARAPKLPPRRCEECGDLFQPRLRVRKFCSRACAARHTRPEPTGELVVRTCPGCGREDVVAAYTARRWPRCSVACGQAYPPERHAPAGDTPPTRKAG